jgi:hypothetical protein
MIDQEFEIIFGSKSLRSVLYIVLVLLQPPGQIIGHPYIKSRTMLICYNVNIIGINPLSEFDHFIRKYGNVFM